MPLSNRTGAGFTRLTAEVKQAKLDILTKLTDRSPTHVSQRWYNPIGAGVAGNTMVAGHLRVYPIIVTRTLNIDRLSLVATAAGTGATFRLAAFNAGADGYPTTLLYGSGAATAVTAASLNQTVALTLNPGIYWLGAALNAATTAPNLDMAAIGWAPPFPIGFTAQNVGSVNNQGYQVTGVTGAIPATFPAIAGVTVTPSVPRVGYRVT